MICAIYVALAELIICRKYLMSITKTPEYLVVARRALFMLVTGGGGEKGVRIV